MKTLKKIDHNTYVEIDSESKKPVTIEMTRDQAYENRCRAQNEDQASQAILSADKEYDG